jgi:hypothetical protein
MVGFSTLTVSLALSSMALADAVVQCCKCRSSLACDVCSGDESEVFCITMRELAGGYYCDGGFDCGLGTKNRDNCCPPDINAYPEETPDDFADICSTNPPGRCFSLLKISTKIPRLESICDTEFKGYLCGSGGWGFYTRGSFAGGELGIGLL